VSFLGKISFESANKTEF